MLGVVLATVVFSPFVLNDVLVIVLTPVLVKYSKKYGVAIAPLVVAEITFTNISSSLTPFGNPQNILLWQGSGISAAGFVQETWLPLLISGALALALLAPFLRMRRGAEPPPETAGPVSLLPGLYLAIVGGGVFVLNFLGVPSPVSLAAVFVLGFAFTRSKVANISKEYDVRSYLILCVLVGSVAALSYLAEPILAPYVSPLANGDPAYTALFMASVSSVISNVPATQLVLGGVSVSPHLAARVAVDAGLAGNIDPVGSFANILALLIVKRSGLPIRKIVVLQLVVGVISFVPAFL